MAVIGLKPIECPRCLQHKEVNVHDDEHHTRECPGCGYTWQYRDGMPTYEGEWEPVAPVDPSAGADSGQGENPDV